MPVNDHFFELKPVGVNDFTPVDFIPDINSAEPVIIDNDFNSGLWDDTYRWTARKLSGQRAALLVIIANANIGTSSSVQIKTNEYCNGIWVKSGTITFATSTTAQAGNMLTLQDISDTVLIAVKITATVTAGSLSLYQKQY